MDLKPILLFLEKKGWKVFYKHAYAGVDFDLYGERNNGLDEWLILIKRVAIFDVNALQWLKTNAEKLRNQAKGGLWKRNFLLFIGAQQSTPQAIQLFQSDSSTLSKPQGGKSITARVYLVDERRSQVYGPIPAADKKDRPLPAGIAEEICNALVSQGALRPDASLQEQVAATADDHRPSTVLRLLEGSTSPDLEVYRVEALRDLDRSQDALKVLEAILPNLRGDSRAKALRYRALLHYNAGEMDAGILMLQDAVRFARDPAVKAACIASTSIGYAAKHCWKLAQDALREAVQLAPDEPRVHFAHASLLLYMDKRLEARSIFEHVSDSPFRWASTYAESGQARVAYLLGEFDEANRLAQSALQHSAESIDPLHVLFQVALARSDLQEMRHILAEIEDRSPQAESLESLRAAYSILEKRQKGKTKAPRGRLASFPSLVQRRNHCGPCTIELVLRYWKEGVELTNDQIAERVKLPEGGTPIYRMKEFFRLVGFEAIHCSAPVPMLKQLIDAGYPAILEEGLPGSNHVVVAIGYDDEAQTIELQDPMTHNVIPAPVERLNQLRKIHLDSAIIAFPAGQGHEKTLARLGLFNDQALELTDQASLAIDEQRYQRVAELMERAVRLSPQYGLAWWYWLQAEMNLWQAAPRPEAALVAEVAAEAQPARERFYTVLSQARNANPDTEYVHLFEGDGALMDMEIQRALQAFQKADEIAPGNAFTMASKSDCLLALREIDKALESAQQAVRHDPASVRGNVLMARCLAELYRPHADHYARAALELAPNWWEPHQAMAEAYLQQNNGPAAWQEIEIVLSKLPGCPEARLLKSIIFQSQNNAAAGLAEIEAVLKNKDTLRPITHYKAQRALCRNHFSKKSFTAAGEQIGVLLEQFPEDPWGAQFQQAVRCERLLEQKRLGQPPDPAVTAEIQTQYEHAIALNRGTSWIVKDYLNYLSGWMNMEEVEPVARRLIESYPDNGNLNYILGDLLARFKQVKAAAPLMVEAIKRPRGISDREQLVHAIETILAGLGLQEGEKAVREVPVPAGGAWFSERMTCLGLVFALYPKERATRARELLQAALEDNPQDAWAMLRLGKVAETDQEQERCFRQALLLAPGWLEARATLADFLNQKERPKEALEFTTGHDEASPELRKAHAFALNRTGRFDEADRAYIKLIEQTPPDQYDVNVFRSKWTAEYNAGEHEKALETADQGLRLFPKDFIFYWYKTVSLCRLERWEQAAQNLESARVNDINEVNLLRMRCEMAYSQWDFAAALPIVDRLIELRQDPPEKGKLGVWGNSRLRILAELGRVDEARQMSASGSLSAEGWGSAAWALTLTRQDALSLEFASRSLELDAEDYRGLYAYAIAARNLDMPDARSTFERLRQAAPLEHNGYEYLALYAALDDALEAALQLAERAVDLGPGCATAWATRGYIHFLSGRGDEARNDLETGWKRALLLQRRTDYSFWYALAILRGDEALAQEYKARATDEGRGSFQRQLLQQIINSYADKDFHPRMGADKS